MKNLLVYARNLMVGATNPVVWSWEGIKEGAGWSYGYDCMMKNQGYLDQGASETQPTYVGFVLLEIKDRIVWIFQDAYCQTWGHDWDPEDTGYGGPDHGYESGSCMRCGFSFHHVMY
jgi:hypothetical protein